MLSFYAVSYLGAIRDLRRYYQIYTGEKKMAKKSDNRFQVIPEEKYEMVTSSRILRDKETGVLYFFYTWGYGGGLTPLLDKDGKVMIDNSDK